MPPPDSASLAAETAQPSGLLHLGIRFILQTLTLMGVMRRKERECPKRHADFSAFLLSLVLPLVWVTRKGSGKQEKRHSPLEIL